MSAPRIESLVSVAELAAALGLHRNTVCRWARLRMVSPPLRSGRSYAWTAAAAARIIAAHRVTNPATDVPPAA